MDDYQEIEQHILEILLGEAIVDISDGNGNIHTCIIKILSGRQQNYINYMYQRELVQGAKLGLISEAELRKIYAEREIWTDKDEERVVVLQNGIKKLKNILPDFKYQRVKYKNIERQIRRTERELNDLLQRKWDLFANSLENRALTVKFRQTAFYCLFKLDSTPFWTEEEFNNFDDIIFINNVVSAYNDRFVLDERTVRKIARSNMWRYRWNSTKNGADLFGKPAAEWGDVQNNLIFWSLYYDWVFEHPECPHHLIDNDEALDAWVRNETRKRNNRNVLNSRKNVVSPVDKKQKYGTVETFVFCDNDPTLIDEIQSQNDPLTRAKLRHERNIIKGKGTVSEWDLRKGDILKGV
ncbi:MAG: hypothetical protein DRP85_00795 [Candidatus Makaraimicrobium thalassicum]|nr:MAG: hypothetical protein DRP85_00795 [Candidatus Omnitrophota bacterium]